MSGAQHWALGMCMIVTAGISAQACEGRLPRSGVYSVGAGDQARPGIQLSVSEEVQPLETLAPLGPGSSQHHFSGASCSL